MTRRLIVNADDFGRSPGINRGIVDAHVNGIVSSTTLMVNLPASAEAAMLAADVPDLGIGLHLNFCYGQPIADGVESLLGHDGYLDRDLTRLAGRASAADIHREARAQLDRFRELLGSKPTHFDSHQHLHSLPVAIEPVAALARDIGVPVRACSIQHRDVLRMLGIACPDGFIIDFYGAERVNAATLIAIMETLPPGVTELMCHPGYDDPVLADSSYRVEREAELITICDESVRSTLTREQICLVSFDLPRSPDLY